MKCTVHAAFAFYTKEVYSSKTNFEVTFSVTNKLLPILSNQKYNQNLKQIAMFARIKKNLTIYIARHTFATYRGNSVPLSFLLTPEGRIIEVNPAKQKLEKLFDAIHKNNLYKYLFLSFDFIIINIKP